MSRILRPRVSYRSAISLVVLMVESTRGVEYLFGIILAVVVANWVAHHIHHDGASGWAEGVGARWCMRGGWMSQDMQRRSTFGSAE